MVWDGNERRKETRVDRELQDLKIDIASFTAKVNEWMVTTKDYRIELCKKVDSLDKKMDCLPQTLPCKMQDERIRGVEQKVSKIEGKASVFGALGGVITYLFTRLFSGK